MTAVPLSLRAQERRTRARFPLVREIRYKTLSTRRDLTGRGQTLNISSSGALFATEHELTPGTKIELSISWPIMLNERASLKMVAVAAVVRVEKQKVAVRFETHEFPIVPPSASSALG